MKPENIYILSNSPGELSGWVNPVVAEIKRRLPGARIEIFLSPCQFKSGTEAEYARGLGVDQVHPVPETLAFCLKGFPADIKKKSGLVLLLGGDQYYGKQISRRLGWPLYVYTQTRARYARQTAAYFVPSEKIKKCLVLRNKISQEKIITIGDLVVDAVPGGRSPAEIKKLLDIPPDNMVVTFMPSSRVGDFRHLLPIFLEVAALTAVGPDRLEFIFNISDFIPGDLLASCLSGYEVEKKSADVWLIRAPGWTGKILINRVYDGLKISGLLVTIPGTNTQQAAYLGIPMLVILPLNRPDRIKFEGLLGLAGNLPLVGLPIKKMAIAFLSRKKNFFALPNISAQKFVVPEMVGVLQNQRIADKILEMIRNPAGLASMSGELKIGSSQKGAAAKMVSILTGPRCL